jgi:hypothetical protein
MVVCVACSVVGQRSEFVGDGYVPTTEGLIDPLRSVPPPVSSCLLAVVSVARAT